MHERGRKAVITEHLGKTTERERERGRDRESRGGIHSDQNNEKRAKKKGEIEV